MGYVPLNNYNHDGGYKRIQSGPNHQGFIVLTSGSTAYGADEGIIVPGSPLSGNLTQGVWGYDANWRYVPSTLPGQSGSLDPTPYNVSGALDTYDATRIYTRDNVAGAQAASAIGPETGKVNPRGGALQARSDVTRPETYMYYGGAAPDNQDYSPYNTPDANSAAEGKTGGGVTHRSFESSLLTNVLGSQGTSDRSQWRYHQPVYCKTYTETRRSETPGLMSTPLRYVYRGSASSYNYNYGSELLANKGGFKQLVFDYERVAGSGTITYPNPVFVASTISGFPSCAGGLISWYRVNTATSDRILVAQGGSSYSTVSGDIGFAIEAEVQCPDINSPTGFGLPGSIGTTSTVFIKQTIFLTSRNIGIPGAINYSDPLGRWSTFMQTYAITLRLSNADGATDTGSVFFTALSPGTYRIRAAADNTASFPVLLHPPSSLTVNGQACTVGELEANPALTEIFIATPGQILVQFRITNGLINPSFLSNPMGMAFTIEGPV